MPDCKKRKIMGKFSASAEMVRKDSIIFWTLILKNNFLMNFKLEDFVYPQSVIQ